MGNRELAVAIDVGGTHLRAALVKSDGTLLKKIKREVGPKRDPKNFFSKLTSLIREVASGREESLSGIGLGLPGICSLKEGIVHQLPHYSGWCDVPAVAILREEFSLPIFLDNDANMAARGEHWLGAAKELISFWMLTLGTGIGGGLFLNGQLWHGESGFAGEVGHMTVVADGRLCACGKKGCWEMYAASSALPPEERTAEAWRQFGIYLGMGIANLAHILDVEHFILGGGISQASENFLETALQTARERCYKKLGERLTIQPAHLKEEANLLGCAAQVFSDSSH